ncbi:hypothetical protein ACJMK2_026745 [Sinanodonta woodiana]|uniref:Uncharacterized protein n=1 Tax=Sinanodonta woodiana TaxID=1069815 RepID=A0ABD3XKM8_SINWO
MRTLLPGNWNQSFPLRICRHKIVSSRISDRLDASWKLFVLCPNVLQFQRRKGLSITLSTRLIMNPDCISVGTDRQLKINISRLWESTYLCDEYELLEYALKGYIVMYPCPPQPFINLEGRTYSDELRY